MADQQEIQTPVDEVISQFEARKDLLASFCAKTKALIEESLQDATIRYQSVQARVKSAKKLRTKYTNPQKGYKALSDITDLAALRVITYYEDEVDQAADVIRREFAVDLANSVDKRATDPDRFGYHAINYVCRHLDRRRSDVEYRRFGDVCFEIQITSILRHAWSEIQHDWYDLRDAFPDPIKRRFSRMAALLEIAESEFLELRNKRAEYIKSVEVQVGADVKEVSLDPLSLRSFIFQDADVRRIDGILVSKMSRYLADEMSDDMAIRRFKIADLAGFRTLQTIRESLVQNEAKLIDYFDRARPHWPRIPPGLSATRGVSIHHLCTLLLCARETEDVLTSKGGILSRLPLRIAQAQISVAKQILARP